MANRIMRSRACGPAVSVVRNCVRRFLPPLVLTLLVATVWHWSAPADPVQAQSVVVEVSNSTRTVSEGDTVYYRVRLSAWDPGNNGTVLVRPHLTAGLDGPVSIVPSLLLFDRANHRTYQQVYVSAAQDDIDNDHNGLGNSPSKFAATVSHDCKPACGTAHAPVNVVVNDDDVRGITVSARSLSVDEGDRVTYLVSLRSEPTGEVRVNLAVGGTDPSAASVSPGSLTFSSVNWSVPQTVVVEGTRDYVDGSSRMAAVTHTVNVGGGYGTADNPSNVEVTVRDDDAKGIVVSPERLAFREDGTATYQVRLSSKPTGSVTVSVSSASPAVTIPSGSDSLVFTDDDNWDQPQTVTVNGARDNDFTGVRSASITNSATGADYGGQSESVSAILVNVDPKPGSRLVVSKTALAVSEGGSNTYTVAMSAAPAGSVTVAISSSVAGVARPSPSSLTFTPDNWHSPRTVTVVGVDDARRIAGARAAEILHRVSGAIEYRVGVVLPDGDAPSGTLGVTVAVPDGGLSVQEGSTGIYTVKLNRRPTGNVQVVISTSDSLSVTASPSRLVFTVKDWSNEKTVTVRSIRDYVHTGTMARSVLTHRVSGGGYDRVPASSVPVNVIDADSLSVIVRPATLDLLEGASGGYSVRLGSKPVSNVTFWVNAVSGLTESSALVEFPSVVADADNFMAYVSGSAALEFTPSNWNMPKTVSLHTVGDGAENGTRAVKFSHSVSGGGYGSYTAVDDFTLLIFDDDTNGITLSSSSVSLGVSGESSYTVRLDNDPGSTGGTVNFSVDPSGIVDLSPASLSFAGGVGGDWSSPKTVTVSGTRSGRATIAHTLGGSTAEVGHVFAKVLADAGSGVSINPDSLNLGENGSGVYTVVLRAQPSSDVIVTAVSNAVNKVTVTPPQRTFTPDNWATPQSFNVYGVSASNGAVPIVHRADGAHFRNTRVGDVAVTVSAATPVVTVSTGSLDIGVGGTGSYNLSKSSGPTTTVTLVSSDPAVASVSPSSVGLLDAAARPVTVTGRKVGTAFISHTLDGGGTASQVSVTVTANAVLTGFALDGDRGSQGSHWSYVGDKVGISLLDNSGLAGGKVWAYRVPGGDDGAAPVSCHVDRTAAFPVREGTFTSGNTGTTKGFVADEVPVSLGLFDLGVNYLCIVDEAGKGVAYKPLQFTVHSLPSTYRVWLKGANPVVKGMPATDDSELSAAEDGALPDDFRVLHAKHSHGDDHWSMPQWRGTGHTDGEALLKTDGALYHCKQPLTAGVTISGCEWVLDSALPSSEPWRIGYVAAAGGEVKAPGDELSFRLDFAPLSDGRERGRFAMYSGPVDLWRLTAGTGTEDAGTGDFAIHEEHMDGTGVVLDQSGLRFGSGSDRYYEFKIDRSTANRDGKTFVAFVECNQDYLETSASSFNHAEVARNKRALPDCSRATVAGVNFDASDSDEDKDARLEPLRLAWGQHSVISGRGLTCTKIDVTVTRTPINPANRNDGYTYSRTYDIECHNEAAAGSHFDKGDVESCDTDLRGAADVIPPTSAVGTKMREEGKFLDPIKAVTAVTADPDATPPVEGVEAVEAVEAVDTATVPHISDPLLCGFGPAEAFVDDVDWGSARYNAARSSYGFVIDWELGYGGGPYLDDGKIMLLPYTVHQQDDDSYRYYGELDGSGRPRGSQHWIVGDAGRLVATGDTADVTFYTPEAHPDWDASDRSWHDSQAMHFAVYVAGMPSEHDYRVDSAAGVNWRRVSLGGWNYGTSDARPGHGTRRNLGLALANSDPDAEVYVPPTIGDFQSGRSLTVSREYADQRGLVHLWIVPCLPWHGSNKPTCNDLTEGAGSGVTVTFGDTSAEDLPVAGPFGVDMTSPATPTTPKVWYSQRFTVDFGNVALDSLDDEPVSLPRQTDTSSPLECSVSRGPGGIWPERLVQGGACDRSDLQPVDVLVKNSGSHGYQKFIVYATGGRSDGLDLVNMRRFASFDSAPEQLARLGLFERVLPVASTSAGSAKVVVTPDMAGADGHAYLLFYECSDNAAVDVCPRNSRSASGVPPYDVYGSPAFAVRVGYADVAGFSAAKRPVCQGLDCSPVLPVLRDAAPDGSGVCSVNVVDGGVDDLTYWPDRYVIGQGCSPGGFDEVTFSIANSNSGARRLAIFSTGGRGYGLDLAQVRRWFAPRSPSGLLGKTGLKVDYLNLAPGATGSVTVDYSMADGGGQVLLLAYECENGICPKAIDLARPSLFIPDRRPLFQVSIGLTAPRAVLVFPTVLTMDEGESGEYGVVLAGAPTGTVTVTTSSSPSGAVSVSPDVLTFDATNWSDLQTVTVSALQDADDADSTVQVTHSVSGGSYDATCPDGCPVTVNVDDIDSPGASITPDDLSIPEGMDGTYTVVLHTQPSATVTVTLSVEPASGVASVSAATLTFTPINWRVPQTVTVSTVHDDVYHSPLRTARITHAFSGGGYDDSVSVSAVNVTVVDAQLPSVGITGPGGVVIPSDRLVMRVGETRDYELSLGSRPAQSLTMSLSTAPSGVVSVSPGSLTFSTANWSAAQTVTITANAVGEAVINHQGSGEVYDRVRMPSIQVEVLPASAPGAALSPVSPMSLPKGATGQYRMTLTQRPTDDVTVSVTSSGSAATVSPTSVLFNVSNWWRGHDFTVKAGDDVGSVTFTHDFSGGIYDGLADLDMTVNVVKSEGPGIIIGSSRDDGTVVPSGDDPAG